MADPSRPAGTNATQDSDLLNLPTELRLIIYELVAGPPGGTIIFEANRVVAPSTALAAICHQVRQEYIPILNAAIDQAESTPTSKTSTSRHSHAFSLICRRRQIPTNGG